MLVKPICFAVMPYGKKPTNAVADAPAEIDFDRLWQAAFQPALQDLGYLPVRADEDIGSNIIGEMIERLAVSDLVIADVTIANANVYYELGIRHAVSPRGCVMLAAEWAQPAFDLGSMRQVRYPLNDASVSDEHAAQIRSLLLEAIPVHAAGESPFYEALPGFPGSYDARASRFRERLEELSAFQAKIAEVRAGTKEAFKQHALQIAGEYSRGPVQTSVALELLILLRDSENWSELLSFVEHLPASMRTLAFVKEQQALALSKGGDHLKAIAAIEELIKLEGDSSERQGLLGGRYKKLWNATGKPEHLDRAIRAYEAGMYLDLNDYFPISNLPRLYRARNRKGDAEKAVVAASLTAVACERARRRRVKDAWLNPTLLAAAFDAGDTDRARDLVDEIRADGPSAFHLHALLPDLEKALAFASDESEPELRSLYAELKNLAEPAEAVAKA